RDIDRGVVEQDIDTAEFIYGLLHESLNIRQTAHVAGSRPRRSASVENRICGRFTAGAIDIGDDHMGAFFSEAARVSFADSVGRAGDDRYFVLKAHKSSIAKKLRSWSLQFCDLKLTEA